MGSLPPDSTKVQLPAGPAPPDRATTMRPGRGPSRLQPLPAVAPACENGPAAEQAAAQRRPEYSSREAGALVHAHEMYGTADQHAEEGGEKMRKDWDSRGTAAAEHGAGVAQQASMHNGDGEHPVPQRKLRAEETAHTTLHDLGEQEPTARTEPSIDCEWLLRRQDARSRVILFAQ